MRVASLVAVLSLSSVCALGAACAASGEGAELHGPLFGVDGSVAETGDGEGGPGEAGAKDAQPSSDASDGSTGSHCTIAIVAGDGATLQGATSKDGKPWEIAAITGGSALSAPAIVATAGGFHAVVRASGDALM